MAGENRLSVEILGTSFTISSDVDPAYLKRILGYLERKIDTTAKKISTSDPLKVSILTSIHIIDELLKIKSHNGELNPMEEESEEMEQITLRLISQLDEAIGK